MMMSEADLHNLGLPREAVAVFLDAQEAEVLSGVGGIGFLEDDIGGLGGLDGLDGLGGDELPAESPGTSQDLLGGGGDATGLGSWADIVARQRVGGMSLGDGMDGVQDGTVTHESWANGLVGDNSHLAPSFVVESHLDKE